MGRRLSPEAIDRIVQLFGKGLDLRIIAQRMGVPIETARYYVKRRTGEQPPQLLRFISPRGHEYTVTDLGKFCQLHGLEVYAMVQLVRGDRAFYRGWKVGKTQKLPQGR